MLDDFGVPNHLDTDLRTQGTSFSHASDAIFSDHLLRWHSESRETDLKQSQKPIFKKIDLHNVLRNNHWFQFVHAWFGSALSKRRIRLIKRNQKRH